MDKWYQHMEHEGEAWERLYRFERRQIIKDRIVTLVSFLLCFPLAWLMSRL